MQVRATPLASGWPREAAESTRRGRWSEVVDRRGPGGAASQGEAAAGGGQQGRAGGGRRNRRTGRRFFVSAPRWRTRSPAMRRLYGALVAVDINRGEIAWTSALGITESLGELADLGFITGARNLGGNIATAGGLASSVRRTIARSAPLTPTKAPSYGWRSFPRVATRRR